MILPPEAGLWAGVLTTAENVSVFSLRLASKLCWVKVGTDWSTTLIATEITKNQTSVRVRKVPPMVTIEDNVYLESQLSMKESLHHKLLW